MKISCIIPARFESSRFPGKPLTLIDGVPMIVRVYNRVKEFDWHHCVVATDDPRIQKVCDNHNIYTIMTGSEHKTGTDRVAEVAEILESDYYINVQGDEPLMPKDNISTILKEVIDEQPYVVNARTLVDNNDAFRDTIIKVVVDENQNLLYMSRYPIPYAKEKDTNDIARYKQVCVYGFSPQALKDFSSWEQGPAEKAESIEILRFLEHGKQVRMVYVSEGTIAVDVPSDVELVERELKRCKVE